MRPNVFELRRKNGQKGQPLLEGRDLKQARAKLPKLVERRGSFLVKLKRVCGYVSAATRLKRVGGLKDEKRTSPRKKVNAKERV